MIDQGNNVLKCVKFLKIHQSVSFLSFFFFFISFFPFTFLKNSDHAFIIFESDVSLEIHLLNCLITTASELKE